MLAEKRLLEGKRMVQGRDFEGKENMGGMGTKEVVRYGRPCA